MKGYLYVPVTASDPKVDTNAVQVGVNYCKRAGGIEATAYPARRREGMVSIAMSTMFAPPSVLLEWCDL